MAMREILRTALLQIKFIVFGSFNSTLELAKKNSMRKAHGPDHARLFEVIFGQRRKNADEKRNEIKKKAPESAPARSGQKDARPEEIGDQANGLALIDMHSAVEFV